MKKDESEIIKLIKAEQLFDMIKNEIKTEKDKAALTSAINTEDDIDDSQWDKPSETSNDSESPFKTDEEMEADESLSDSPEDEDDDEALLKELEGM